MTVQDLQNDKADLQEREPPIDTPRPVGLLVSVVLVAGVLAIGVLAAWTVTLSWVLMAIALMVQFGIVALAIWVGFLSYRVLGELFPRWARITVAVVVCLSIGTVATELTRSHRLIRYYQFWDSAGDN